MNIKKNDAVKIIAGKDKGQIGEVLAVHPSTNKITVKGVNMVTKHVRRKRDDNGGVRSEEAPLDASNAMLVCPLCREATRVSIGIDEEGDKYRICKKCGGNIDSNTKSGRSTARKAKRALKKKDKAGDADSDE